jgi:autotransporter-associated beta strand protein
LNAQSTYGGTTNVNAGTLRISNATGSATGTGTVSVNDGGTLTGGGIIAGSIVGATGGTISPGENGVGTLTTGALTLNAGSTLNYEWDAALANDRITVTGADGLTINGGRFKLLNTGAATTFGTNGVYNLISFLGNIGGAGLSALGVDPTSVLVGKSYSFGQSGGFVTLAIGNTGVTPNFWNVDASGDWTTSTNWSLGTAPNAPQAFAAFGGGSTVISAPRTVTLNANQTVGTVAFNSVQPFTINGTNTLTLDNGTDPAQITVSGGSHTLAVPMNAVSTAVQFSALNPSDALTVSGALSGTTAVAKVGAGSVTLSGANTYTGTTSVNSGTLALSGIGKLGNVSNPLVVFGGTLDLGGTSQSVGAATITGGTVTNGTLTPASTSISGTGNLTISANIGGTGGLNKTGANTVTLAGNNSYTGATTLNGGALAITNNNSLGAATSPINFTAGSLLVEGTGATTLGTRPLTGFPTLINVAADGHTFTVGQNFTATAALMKRGLGTLALSGTSNFPAAFVVNAGTVHITAGTVTDTATTNVPVQIANEANSTATLTVSGNAVLTTGPSEIFVGQGFPTAVGVLNLQDSGTINTNNWVAVGRGNGVGTVNMSGGTFNKLGGNGNHVTIGSNTATSVGTFNQSGGVVNSADSEFWVGESGTGTYNISGNAQANLLALRLGVNASGNGTANLNGGTVNTGQVVNVGTGALNFNGGTLRAVAPVAEFVGASVQTTVQAGGAIIDTNGFSTSLSSFLSHDPSLDMDGGLRKRGEGVLTVTNAASYNGPTVVEAGTLALGGSISGSANIAVRAGATLNPTAAGDFLLNSIQTLGGSGTVLGNVNTETGARLSPGDDIGNLTIGGNLNLTLAVTPNASAALIFGLAGTNDRITLTTGSVAIGTGLLGFNDFAFTTLTGFAPGTYTLFDTSTAISGSLDNANLTGSLGGFTGTLGFAESGQDLVLVVVPEPGSAALLLASFGSLLGLRRFRSGQRS